MKDNLKNYLPKLMRIRPNEDKHWENQDSDNQDLENLEFSENFITSFGKYIKL